MSALDPEPTVTVPLEGSDLSPFESLVVLLRRNRDGLLGRRNVPLEAFSAVADIVSAAAIVATLVYLAIQIRKAQIGAESQSLQAAEALASNWRTSLSRDPQVAGLWRRATESFTSLTPDEKEQAKWLFSDLFWLFQGMLLRANQGALDSASQELIQRNIRLYVQFPGIREWWPDHKQHYSDDFATIVEKCIADASGGNA